GPWKRQFQCHFGPASSVVRFNGPQVNRSRRSGPLKGRGGSLGFVLRYLWIRVEFDAGRLLRCYPCLDPSPDEFRQGKQASPGPGGEIGRVEDGALIDTARRLAPPPARGRPSPRRRLPQLSGKSGVVFAVKLYPAGATTNSQDGVTDIFGKCLPVLEEMAKHNMPLLV
ncbi:hypothetical protein GW17_00040133, partial [Ensete ventricosum]